MRRNHRRRLQVRRACALSSLPSTSATHGARTSTSFSPSSAYVRSTMLAPARRASCQYFFVICSVARKEDEVHPVERRRLQPLDKRSLIPRRSHLSRGILHHRAAQSPMPPATTSPARRSTLSQPATTPRQFQFDILCLVMILLTLGLQFRHRSVGFSTAGSDPLSLARNRGVAPLSAPRIRQPRHHARHQIRHRNDDQHVLGIQHNQRANHARSTSTAGTDDALRP